MARWILGILFYGLLWVHLAIFFWLYLYPYGGYVVAFLIGVAVPALWTFVATASLGVREKPAAIVVLGKCLVFTVYSILAAAFAGALAVEGPWGWARLTSIAAVGLLARVTRLNYKQAALKYGL
ncbi:hypothetical protein HYW67_04240 [Candidatus Parcubacteria bacterium]|nr:hypothetical protein [Candidatus Parcubacteria bacterium]